MINVYDLVVVGGGPCGIAAVVEAKVNGIKNVLLLEKGDNHSQTIRHFYKDKKRVDKEYKGMESETKGSVAFEAGTKESTLDHFDSLLDNDKIDTAFNCEVEKVEKKDANSPFYITTPTAGYRANNVIIAVGKMGKPNKPNYKLPPSLSRVINYDLNNASWEENVIVIGGGNSAAEYALELSYANKTTLCYRKPKFTRLNETNMKLLDEAVKEKRIILKMNTDIESIENESGKVKVNYTNSQSELFDRAIFAIGGSTPVELLKKCGVALDENNQAILNENLRTPTEGLYVGGDIATKNGGSIVVALNHAHIIIQDIIKNNKNK